MTTSLIKPTTVGRVLFEARWSKTYWWVDSEGVRYYQTICFGRFIKNGLTAWRINLWKLSLRFTWIS